MFFDSAPCFDSWNRSIHFSECADEEVDFPIINWALQSFVSLFDLVAAFIDWVRERDGETVRCCLFGRLGGTPPHHDPRRLHARRSSEQDRSSSTSGRRLSLSFSLPVFCFPFLFVGVKQKCVSHAAFFISSLFYLHFNFLVSFVMILIKEDGCDWVPPRFSSWDVRLCQPVRQTALRRLIEQL